ncbi:MAG: Gfo/Idh/MocA family oxidoreductase [Ruminococcaceae bacterium]|nr:Gfo/Idh/MocA family oxidoreductase [Oscillospiraceae bacterium]
MAKKLRIGVIGAGGMATNIHVPSLAQIEECEIVAICDLFEEKAKELAEKFGVKKTYALHHEMLKNEQLDAAVVLVNPDRTYWVAHDCLEAGLHVLMEKPAGICAYQTHSLERIAKKNGKIAAVAMNRRHIPLIQEVLKRFEGEKITEIDGRFMKYSDIGSGWHYASAYNCDIVHIIDLIRYVAGSEVTNAATLISKNDSSVDNAWSSVMRFENGIAGTLRANYQSSGRFHDIEIHGPRVSAIVSLGMGDTKCWAKIHYTTGRTIYSAASAGVTVGNYEYLDGAEIAKSTVYADYYGYKAENVDFVNAVLNGTQPLATIEDAAKTMDLLEYLLEKKI